jgi:chromosomal replication initiation ATPase DnaA
MILVAQIQQAIAHEHGIDPAIMREPDGLGSRLRTHAWPRQEAMRLAILLTEHSLTRVGHFFGHRDRTTVLSASRRVAKRMRGDPALHDRMRRVTLGLVLHG